MKLTMRWVLTMLLALLGASVYAQDFYYQSIMPDGRVVVGDKPAPGAKEVRKAPLSKGNTSAPLSNPADAAAAANPQKQAAESADAEVRSAQNELEGAKKALETGREPLASERIGTAGGSSRLTDAYFQRIKALEAQVSAAQARLDAALTKRNTTR